MINKKGLSTIVTTLIIVLLVLAAIGIVWTPIKNLLTTTTDDLTIDCFELEFSVSNINSDTDNWLSITVNRGAKGVSTAVDTKIVISSATDSENAQDGPSLTPLAKGTVDLGYTILNPTKVTVYAVDSKGEICSDGSEFTI